MPPKSTTKRTSPRKTKAASTAGTPATPDTPDGVKFEKHHWSADQVTFLLEEMADEANDGKKCAGSFKKPTWNALAARFNRRFKCLVSYKQLKSKVQVLKACLQLCTRMGEYSGFGWDPVKSAPTAPADVMSE
ncbi:hypothetical protein BJ741DRAFT_189603 [Chytriomyces cf. hyalinus JEL632]|nr:hypothetical protein BJ741DRAFT_189603 [Chytriomyces cf. hyalinus JEL632]